MRVTVELSYAMSKACGKERFEVEGVATVADAVAKSKTQVGPEFDKLSRLAAVAVNGVLVSHKRGMKTRLSDGDVVGFVHAAAGG